MFQYDSYEEVQQFSSPFQQPQDLSDGENIEFLEERSNQQISEEIQDHGTKSTNFNSSSQGLEEDNSYQQIVLECITTKQITEGHSKLTENEIDKQKKQNQIEVVGVKQKSKQNHKEEAVVKYFPGDTKNIPKNFGGHFKKFIKEICEINQRDLIDQDWQTFCKINNQKISKNNLGEFLQTKYGQMFGKEFFGQYLWAKPFLNENKSDISQYFQFNKYYRKRVKTNDIN